MTTYDQNGDLEHSLSGPEDEEWQPATRNTFRENTLDFVCATPSQREATGTFRIPQEPNDFAAWYFARPDHQK